MPQAVTHILVPIILLSLFKDYYDSRKRNKRKNKKFSLHYVFLAGIGGVLPDIDIIFSLIKRIFTENSWWLHKTFTHSIFFPILLFLLFVALKPTNPQAKICNIGKHNLSLSIIFLMLSLGTLTHISLDAFFGNQAFFLYPFSSYDFGMGYITSLPIDYGLIMATLDGILLVIWITYLQVKHKISDFI
ncbi:MAG: metal-dependent hydrolase [Candidatus Pacearchaeota archaeon]|nr:metal-dependent hydrolase [Candidatus Pacearchaeota archaeon]